MHHGPVSAEIAGSLLALKSLIEADNVIGIDTLDLQISHSCRNKQVTHLWQRKNLR
jgi:hypothetical protein